MYTYVSWGEEAFRSEDILQFRAFGVHFGLEHVVTLMQDNVSALERLLKLCSHFQAGRSGRTKKP